MEWVLSQNITPQKTLKQLWLVSKRPGQEPCAIGGAVTLGKCSAEAPSVTNPVSLLSRAPDGISQLTWAPDEGGSWLYVAKISSNEGQNRLVAHLILRQRDFFGYPPIGNLTDSSKHNNKTGVNWQHDLTPAMAAVLTCRHCALCAQRHPALLPQDSLQLWDVWVPVCCWNHEESSQLPVLSPQSQLDGGHTSFRTSVCLDLAFRIFWNSSDSR